MTECNCGEKCGSDLVCSCEPKFNAEDSASSFAAWLVNFKESDHIYEENMMEWVNEFVKEAKRQQKVVEYEHHGSNVKVREDLKGKHRDHCLCFRCGGFKIGSADEKLLAYLQVKIRELVETAKEEMSEGCVRSAILYSLCRELNMTTPVWECPECEEKQL